MSVGRICVPIGALHTLHISKNNFTIILVLGKKIILAGNIFASFPKRDCYNRLPVGHVRWFCNRGQSKT